MHPNINVEFTNSWLANLNYGKEVMKLFEQGMIDGEFFVDDDHMVNQSTEFIQKLVPILRKDANLPYKHC